MMKDWKISSYDWGQGKEVHSHHSHSKLYRMLSAIEQEKETKAILFRKRNEIFLFTDNMLVYIENFRESTNKSKN